MKQRILFFLILSFTLMSCGTTYKTITYCEPVRGADSLQIHEGIMSRHAHKIKYMRDGKNVATITLSEPVMVAMAEQEEAWGFFQFPNIGIAEDGTLRVSWQMIADSHESYGKAAGRPYTPMVSKDGGKTWIPQDKSYDVRRRGYNIYTRKGDFLQVSTPATKAINNYKRFPKAVAKDKTYSYFKEEELPDDLRGFYLNRVDPNGKSTMIHAKLNDPGLLRYAINGDMPIVWWGNIKELSNGTLVAGVYPTFYLDEECKVTRGGVSFYESNDEGKAWNVISRIPFVYDGIANVRGNKSFDEPAFEILPDSTFICVMRSGATSPMYRTFSKDKGRTWTTPEPFTPNGVKPNLMVLKNGVLVLASGRPGIQVRVSFDGGYNWTDAIDMVPYMHADGAFKWDVSCGYASIIEGGSTSFYLVYSDFTTKNNHGDLRKSIWFRKIKVRKK